MKRRNAQICSVLLAAVLVFLGTFAARAESLDLNKTVALTVKPGPEAMTDLANADVTVDLYKVADASASTDGSSYYTFAVKEGVTLSKKIATYEDLAALTNDDWGVLAQDAAKSVLLDAKGEVRTEAALKAEADPSALSAGLYLVIAHSKDAPLSAYVHTDGTTVTTTASSPSYLYTWAPELIALPSTVAEMGTDGTYSEVTTAGGDWKYEITAMLKPSQEEAMGDLLIHKTLTNYHAGSPVTFVFLVVATVGNTVVFEEVASLTFNGPGTQTYTFTGKIPVGAEVTVTEIYSGAGYKRTSDEKVVVTMDKQADGTVSAEVSFTNTYNGENKQGFGILNEFKYTAGDWQHTKR